MGKPENDNELISTLRPSIFVAQCWVGLFPVYFVVVLFMFMWGYVPQGYEAFFMLSIPIGFFISCGCLAYGRMIPPSVHHETVRTAGHSKSRPWERDTRGRPTHL